MTLAYLYQKNINNQISYCQIFYIIYKVYQYIFKAPFDIERYNFVKCHICGQILEMKNTCTNHIRRHLQKMHQIQLNDQQAPTQTESIIDGPKISPLTPSPNLTQAKLEQLQFDQNPFRKNRSSVWSYSKKINVNGQKKAQCNYCKWEFQMKTTCTNQIRRHLQKEHKIPLTSQKIFKDKMTQKLTSFNVEVPLPQSHRARSEVWRYAEKVIIKDQIFIKCNYCAHRIQMNNTSTSPIRRHLEEAHKVIFSQKLVDQSKAETNTDLIIAQLASVSLLSYRQIVEIQLICKNKKILNINIPSSPIEISAIIKRIFHIKCEHIKQMISLKFAEELTISIQSCEIQSKSFFSINIFDQGKCMYKLPLIRQIPHATTEWIKDKIFWLLEQMGVQPHQIKTLVSYDTAAMAQLARAMGWTHQICLLQMINNVIRRSIKLNEQISMDIQNQDQNIFDKNGEKDRLYEQSFKFSTTEEIITKFIPEIIIQKNKLDLDASMKNVFQVCYMTRQKLENPGCSIIKAQTFIDTLTLTLLKLNSQTSKKVSEQIIKEYQRIRNDELVWAGIYLMSQNVYKQYMSRCLFKKMQIAQIEYFLVENFDQFGEVNFSKFQQGKYDDEIYQQHQNEVEQMPYNSFLASVKTYRQEGIKSEQLRQIQKRINMIPSRMIGHEQIFRNYPEKLEQESIICLNFLNWYFKCFKSETQ